MTKWEIGNDEPEIVGGPPLSEREECALADVQLAVNEWLNEKFPAGAMTTLPDGWTDYADLPRCKPMCARALVKDGLIERVDVSSWPAQARKARQ